MGLEVPYHPDDLVLEAAREMGWCYDMSFDLFRKRMPNGDIVSLSRQRLTHDVSGYSVGGVIEYLHLLEVKYLDDCEQRLKRSRRVLKVIALTLEEVVGS